MREVVSRCDICKDPGAVTYTIAAGSSEVEVDLCDTHAKPLVKVMGAGRVRAQKDPAARTGMRSLEDRIRGI